MPGSPLARTAAFAALLTIVLVGWDQCASRGLHERALAEVDVALEQSARAIADQLGDRFAAQVARRALLPAHEQEREQRGERRGSGEQAP